MDTDAAKMTPPEPDLYIHVHGDGTRYLWESRVHGTNDDACWRVDSLNGEGACTPVWFSNVPVLSGGYW